MGRNTRQRLFGHDCERVGDYNRHHALIAHCTCGHERVMHTALLMKIFGEQETLAKVRLRLRCNRCGRKEPTFRVKFG